LAQEALVELAIQWQVMETTLFFLQLHLLAVVEELLQILRSSVLMVVLVVAVVPQVLE
jgi:hypothetical protein